MNDSPWAIPTPGTMDDPSDSEQPASAAPPMGVSPSGVPGRQAQTTPGVRWDGSVGKNRKGHLATIPLLVRWENAAIIRQALVQEKDPDAGTLDSAANDDIIISVAGLLPANRIKGPATITEKSSSDGDPQAQSTEEILEWFMSNSHLRLKGHADLEPRNVRVNATSGTVRIFFKRDESALTNKPDALFLTRYGSVKVQTRFRTKDMVSSGNPDF